MEQVQDMKKIAMLFKGWQETMIDSCLQGYMGKAYATSDYQSAQIIIADFCFFAGEPSIELLHHKVWDDFIILVPQNLAWAELMAEEFPQATQRERYATRKDVNHFDKELLLKNISHLSDNYILKEIDENLYNQLISQEWSKDLCSQFVTSAQFLESGIGFVVKENDEVIAGVSSYTVYQGGIEIEIDTRADKRRLGLAKICASKMILECLDRGLYPSWDAHNPISLNLALSLGYVFDKKYVVYELIEK